jgi:hypothetical protein
MKMRTALDDLDWHWGEVYDLAVTRAGWVAKRLDNNRALVADSPEGLRDLIWADYAAEPVSRDCCRDLAAGRASSPAGRSCPHCPRTFRLRRCVPALRGECDQASG